MNSADVDAIVVADNFAGSVTSTEWGIQWGDGIGEACGSRADARWERSLIRDAVKQGVYSDAELVDLEPIKIVRREVTLSVTPWEERS
jgi:hypothetical protein